MFIDLKISLAKRDYNADTDSNARDSGSLHWAGHDRNQLYRERKNAFLLRPAHNGGVRARSRDALRQKRR